MRALAITALLVLAGAAVASHADEASPAPAPPQLLAGEILSAQFADGVPDLGYDPDWEWQALVCGKGCALVPTKLAMTPVQVHPYDGEPTPGHVYTVPVGLEGPPLVLFRGLPSPAVSHPPTYLHAAMARFPAASTPGTLEVEFTAPELGKVRIVPRFAGEIDGTPTFKVYLETESQRQLLGLLTVDAVVGPSAIPRGAQLVRWAGDLDGDGKLDLVLGLHVRAGTDAAATLFLSSAATDGALVGLAASFSYWPVGDPGC